MQVPSFEAASFLFSMVNCLKGDNCFIRVLSLFIKDSLAGGTWVTESKKCSKYILINISVLKKTLQTFYLQSNLKCWIICSKLRTNFQKGGNFIQVSLYITTSLDRK